LAASRRRQCVTDCAGQIASLGPLDRSLSSARRMEFDELEFEEVICYEEKTQ
jgi:hypothetical protein